MSNVMKCVVHKFKLSGDVDDPELYAAEPIYNWQQTEAGKWVTDNAIDMYWSRTADIITYGYEYMIVAEFIEKDLVYWNLRYK